MILAELKEQRADYGKDRQYRNKKMMGKTGEGHPYIFRVFGEYNYQYPGYPRSDEGQTGPGPVFFFDVPAYSK